MNSTPTFARIERPGEVDAREAQLAAEASLALACEQELAKMGGRDALAEDEINYEAASKVSAQIEIECAEDAEACGTPEEAEYLRRVLVIAPVPVRPRSRCMSHRSPYDRVRAVHADP